MKLDVTNVNQTQKEIPDIPKLSSTLEPSKDILAIECAVPMFISNNQGNIDKYTCTSFI